MVEGQNGTAPKQPSFANQLGRRNLTPERMEVYISQLYRAAKKSEGFEPGESGNPSGVKQRAQNEPVAKSHETAKKVGEQVGKSEKTVRRGSSQGIQVMKCEIMHVVKMTTRKTKDRNVVEGQNGLPLESPKTAAKKSEGFKPGDEGGPGRGNKTGAQNEPVFKSHETAKKVGEQVGKSENTSDLSLINVISF